MSGKVSARSVGSKGVSDLTQEVMSVLLRLSKREDLAFFVQQVLTRSELIMLGRRFRIAKRLLANRTSTSIRQEFTVGIATVSSVERWLEDLPPGLRKALGA